MVQFGNSLLYSRETEFLAEIPWYDDPFPDVPWFAG